MTATQLALDIFSETRLQPDRGHQRGYVRLPHDTAGLGKTGAVVPAWVCCRCGGVEITEFCLELNHGCCTGIVSLPCDRGLPEWARRFDPHWMPDVTTAEARRLGEREDHE